MSDFLSLDQELLIQILEPMTYAQLMDWCQQISPDIRRLCQDETSLVGQMLQRKKKEEVIAIIENYAEEEEGMLGFLLIISGKEPYVRETFTNVYITVEEAEKIAALRPGENPTFEHNDGVLFFYGEEWANLEFSEGNYNVFIDLDRELVIEIFKSALRLKKENIDQLDGFVAILPGLESKLILNRP